MTLEECYEAGVKQAMQEAGMLKESDALDYLMAKSPDESMGTAMGRNIASNIPAAAVGVGTGYGMRHLLAGGKAQKILSNIKNPKLRAAAGLAGIVAPGVAAGGLTHDVINKSLGGPGFIGSMTGSQL